MTVYLKKLLSAIPCNDIIACFFSQIKHFTSACRTPWSCWLACQYLASTSLGSRVRTSAHPFLLNMLKWWMKKRIKTCNIWIHWARKIKKDGCQTRFHLRWKMFTTHNRQIRIVVSCVLYSESCVQCTKIINKDSELWCKNKIKATWRQYIKKYVSFFFTPISLTNIGASPMPSVLDNDPLLPLELWKPD